MNKKSLILSVVLLVGAVSAVLLGNHSQPAPLKHLSSQTLAQPTADKTTTVSPSTTTTTATDAAPQTSQNTQSTPAFGQDPNNPGQYLVYDRTSVMNSAGIPSSQQSDADTAISRVSNWSYGNFLTLCKRGAGPSSMTSGNVRDSQAAFGPTVYTDAVIQLKWCVQWMNDNNLTWQTI